MAPLLHCKSYLNKEAVDSHFRHIKYRQPNSVLICTLIGSHEIHIAKSCVAVGRASIRLGLTKLDLGSVQWKAGRLSGEKHSQTGHSCNPRLFQQLRVNLATSLRALVLPYERRLRSLHLRFYSIVIN